MTSVVTITITISVNLINCCYNDSAGTKRPTR